jgi:hypothetical protein
MYGNSLIDEVEHALSDIQDDCVFSGDNPCEYQVGGDHYTKMGVQPWDVVDDWNIAARIGYYRGNAVKYILRAGSKGDMKEDLLKAHHYLEKLLSILPDA